MKGKLAFDPADYDYGPATARVRELFALVSEIDWFAPTRIDEVQARALFSAHRALCHQYRSDLFPGQVEIDHVWGDWVDFTALCTRVRHPQATYDWKFSALKPMSHGHAAARGWSNNSLAVDFMQSRPGDLFIKVNNTAMVNAVAPRPELRAFVPDRWQEPAGFYWGYATGDFHDAIQWELAEPGAQLASNPFTALLRCYVAGCYPFVFSPTEVQMFSFTRGELPVARVVR